MHGVKIVKPESVPARHKAEHAPFEYFKRVLTRADEARQCSISMLSIPPGKSAYPYHYHLLNEEAFFILKGQGALRTPQGIRTVGEGDFIFFPARPEGCHRLENTSDAQALEYLDFSTRNPADACFYPDSGKVGVFSEEMALIWREGDRKPYYDGE